MFNTDGTPAFGTNGILICDKPTMTYSTDYALSLAPNGDILMAYWDTRNDLINKEFNEVYLYRYSQGGNPVWAKDGVRFSTGKSDDIENVYEVSPTLCVSGNNIYVGIYRIETGESYFYIQRLDEKGSPVCFLHVQEVIFMLFMATKPSDLMPFAWMPQETMFGEGP